MKPPHQRLVLEAVLTLGECSTSQVLAAVGADIDATAAARAGRRRAKDVVRRKKKAIPCQRIAARLIQYGKRSIVSEVLSVLTRLGKLERVRKGVYRPALPKLFMPSKTG